MPGFNLLAFSQVMHLASQRQVSVGQKAPPGVENLRLGYLQLG